MTLYEKLIKKIETAETSLLIEALGYHVRSKGKNALESFSRSGGVYVWLKSGHYDFVHNAESFLYALADALHLESDEVDAAIAEAKARQDRIRTMAKPFIFIETGFRRKSEPVFVLALLEPKRRICLDKEMSADETLEETLERVLKIVRKHYIETRGELPVWGKIRSYRYHHTDGTVWEIDTKGKISSAKIETDDGPRAFLFLK